jgi:Ser/Thr protein kinase RdoA (MazF antagonist)
MSEVRSPTGKSLDHLAAAADRFKPRGKVIGVREFGNGNVHDTFLVTLSSGEEAYFVLQRMNTEVFRRPELVMRNLRTVTGHVSGRLKRASGSLGRRWEVPRVLPAQDGRDYWIDPGGSFWRALSFVEAAQSFDAIRDVDHAREVGIGLGTFHNLISGLPVEQLADTLPGFHLTPLYLRHYDGVLARKSAPQSRDVDFCMHFVEARRGFGRVLEDAKAQGLLRLRPIHGDPKVSNVLIEAATGRAISMIDLDTVKPGLVHYDIGDCLRSCCNPLGEETDQWEAVRFDLEFCRAILQGYLSLARAFLTDHDYEYLFAAIRLIAFELGLRFFTDYLEGDVYFKAGYQEHNLARALVQFSLAESIESQEESLRTIIRDLE